MKKSVGDVKDELYAHQRIKNQEEQILILSKMVLPPQTSIWNPDLRISVLVQTHLLDIPIFEHILHPSTQCLIWKRFKKIL